MSDKELIKGRKAMFKQNYSYAKKMSSEITKGNNFIKSDAHLEHYKNQDGFKIADNIEIKFKPFFYGRKISELGRKNVKILEFGERKHKNFGVRGGKM